MFKAILLVYEGLPHAKRAAQVAKAQGAWPARAEGVLAESPRPLLVG